MIQRKLNYFVVVSATVESTVTESTANVSGVASTTADESTAPSSEGLLVQEAKATIPATNARANNFFIFWV
jgi:hypothetical protein